MSRYEKSNDYYNKAKSIIPLASQTYSKSTLQYPFGTSPLCADRADKSYLWDIDGNQYIDLVCGLWTVGLGYNDKDVNNAISEQLKSGSIFSLSHQLEYDVAKLIVDMVPSAEMVRFGKNGTDATSAAVRIARAYTRKEHVAICGYHGWQDWYISITNKNSGIPACVTDLSHKFTYNDIESLKKIFTECPNQIAAVILEPMNIYFPEDDFLIKVRELCDKHGAVLIFDEIVTGFRMSKGGAQEYFGVTPDLTTLGKSIANGMPLSVITGKKELMSMLDQVYFSGTFGGETLSLAAAKAVLTKHLRPDLLHKIEATGQYLSDGINASINDHSLNATIELSGHPHWKHMILRQYGDYTPFMIKTFLCQEFFKHGVLSLGPSYISHSLTNTDIEKIIAVYDIVFYDLQVHLKKSTLLEAIHSDVLEPVFSVR